MNLSSLYYVLTLLLCWYSSSSNSHPDGFCQGHWETLPSMEQQPYPIKAGRTPKQANNSALGYLPWDQPWFWEACPSQTTLHSCHFHSNKTHADLLERRIWVTNDPLCLEFSPFEFLEQLRDRRVIMVGDSLLTQLWQVLVCALHGSAEHRLYVNWAKMWRCNEVTCPHDEAKHSNCHGGILRFPSANVTIVNKKMYKYSKEYFLGTLQRLKVSPRDIVLVNFGLHYNDEKEYSTAIESMINDLQNHPEAPRWNLGFLETTPQHYPASNGYFAQGEQNGNTCRPLAMMPKTASLVSEPSTLAPGDWRNHVIHRVFGSSTASASSGNSRLSLRIIPIAHGLYSQFDAHVAIEPYPSPPWLDCTHWCFPSGALRYYLIHLHNAIRRMIGRDPAARSASVHSGHVDATTSSLSNQRHGHHRSKASSVNDVSLLQGLQYPDGTLVKGGGRSIYLIRNHMRCEFGSFAAFQKLGLDLKNVVKLSEDELDEIPVGPTIL